MTPVTDPKNTPSQARMITTMIEDNLTDGSATLVLREPFDDKERWQATCLLVAAGWNPEEANGTMIVAYDSALATVVGAGVAVRRCHCTFELLMWAYIPNVEPSACLDQRLVRAIGDNLRRNGAHRVVAQAARSSPEQMAVLLACGFVADESDPHGEISLEL